MVILASPQNARRFNPFMDIYIYILPTRFLPLLEFDRTRLTRRWWWWWSYLCLCLYLLWLRLRLWLWLWLLLSSMVFVAVVVVVVVVLHFVCCLCCLPCLLFVVSCQFLVVHPTARSTAVNGYSWHLAWRPISSTLHRHGGLLWIRGEWPRA